jgi:hypothetical protein
MANIIKPKRGSVAPTTANLVDGEIAINTADKKIYTNIGGTVHELSPSTATTPAGSNTQVQFNNNGSFGASSNFVFNSSLNSVTIKSTLNINKVTGVGGLFITAGDTTTTAQAIGNLEFVTNQSPGKTIAIKTNNGTNLLTLTLDPTNNKLELLNENAALTTTFIVDGTIEAGIQIDAPYFKGSLLGATQQECRNETGSLISKGTPVYIVGYSGNRVLIAPAEANNSAKMPAVGLLETDIADSNNGHYTILGVAKNINTSSYAVNETLYIASAGGLTNVRPTGATTLIQNIGKVVNVGTNGEILVMGPGRSNDVPNTITARTGLYTNDANGIRLYDLDSSNYLRLRPADTLASDINFILPADVGTAKQVLGIQSVVGKSATLDWQSPAYLTDSQTFTAKQTFTSGVDLTGALTGPGSGVLSIDNGAGSVVIGAADITLGNGTLDFTIDAASGTVDGSAFEWQTGDLSTGTLVTTGNITLQNAERIQNTTNGRVDIAPAPSASSFGLSIDMTSKGTGARLTTVTGTSGTTLSTGVLESLVEFQSPKLTLTTTTPSTSVGGCLEYDGKVTYANTASGRGLMVTEQTSILTSSRNINSATGNQNIFGTPQDVITLAANTTYMIRGYLFLSMGTTTTRHIALRFTESVSANPPTIHFSTIGMPSTGGAASRAQDMAYFTTLSGGNMTQSTITNANYNAWITGVITTVDSVTITPQIAFSAAPGNTCSVNMGTYISFIPFGSNTMAAIGPWS